MCILKNMDKVGETYTPEEVTTEKEKFKAVQFCYGNMNLDMDNYVKI